MRNVLDHDSSRLDIAERKIAELKNSNTNYSNRNADKRIFKASMVSCGTTLS
jgi:hypothetical protein